MELKFDITDLISAAAKQVQTSGIGKRQKASKTPEVKPAPAPAPVRPKGHVEEVTLVHVIQTCSVCGAQSEYFGKSVLTTFHFTNGMKQSIAGHFSRFNPEHPRKVIEMKETIECCLPCFLAGRGLRISFEQNAAISNELPTLCEREIAVERPELN